jgi:hypothetical protein
VSQLILTAGIDVGDRYSYLCVLDTASCEVLGESRISTSPAAFERRFSGSEQMRSAIEAGYPLAVDRPAPGVAGLRGHGRERP